MGETQPLAQPAQADSAVITTTVDAAPVPPPAAAAPAAAPVDAAAADVKDLSLILGHYADENSDARTWVALVGFAAGAAIVPASIALIERDPDPTVYYFSLGVGIGAAVGGLLNLLIGGSDFETILEHHRARIAQGGSATQIALETEAEWAAAAQSARSMRKTSGITSLISGAVFIAAGVVLAVIDPIDSNEFSEQYDFATLLMVVGGLGSIGAAQLLFAETPIETSYRAFTRGRSFLGDTKVSVAPTRGGVMLAMGTRF